jgi:hypothetical protein
MKSHLLSGKHSTTLLQSLSLFCFEALRNATSSGGC